MGLLSLRPRGNVCDCCTPAGDMLLFSPQNDKTHVYYQLDKCVNLSHFYLLNSARFLAFVVIEYTINSPLFCVSLFILGVWFRTTESSRLEGASKIIQYNHQPSTTTVAPKPLTHITQHQIQMPPKGFQGW